MADTVITTVRMDKQTKAAIEAEAALQLRSFSAQVKLILNEWVKNNNGTGIVNL